MKILSSAEKEWKVIKAEMAKDSNGNPLVKSDSDDATKHRFLNLSQGKNEPYKRIVNIEENPEMLRLEPHELFDEAIVGTVQRINMNPVLCYDTQMILDILQSAEGLTQEEAIEHFDYNIAGSYLGENTPVFLEPAFNVKEAHE